MTGDVVVALFPFSDRAVLKPRPGVVLSSANLMGVSGQTVLAMITTAERSTWPHDVKVLDRSAAGLRRPSFVRMRLATVANDLIAATIGSLSQRDRAALREALAQALPL